MFSIFTLSSSPSVKALLSALPGLLVCTCTLTSDKSPIQITLLRDYLNDIELLRTAGESYAMANAHEQLAALAKYRCPSNDEDGVCRTIRAVFDL